VVPPGDTIRVQGVRGETWVVEVFRKREETCGQVLLAVDTATGKDRDHSTVVVIDKQTRALCAAFDSGSVLYDDLARVTKAVQRYYTTPAEQWFYLQAEAERVPLALVEDNGVGDATCVACDTAGVIYQRLHTDEASKGEGLLEAKRATEAGILYGPKRLAEEADELHRDDLGRWKGKKDLVMACGFALRELRKQPYRARELPPDPNVIRHKDKIRRASGAGQRWS
jgi:hypothetical protein